MMNKHFAQINGYRLRFASIGTETAPAVVLSHALASRAEIWGYQLPLLSRHFRVILYDVRGHGESEASGDSYSLEELANDVVKLLDHLSIARTALVGLSLGGMIGQVLALTAPERLSALALCSTGSEANEAMQANFGLRIEAVRLKGMESQVEPTLARWFSPEFLQSAPRTTAWVGDLIRRTSPDGFIGCCRALQKLNVTERLRQIKVPTLLIPGEKDQGFPPSVSEAMRERIDGSRLEILMGAAHLGIVEKPHEFNEILLPFLAEHLLA
jgi:3-oxoadipate enol-lactonase